jgi:hypothetical protein
LLNKTNFPPFLNIRLATLDLINAEIQIWQDQMQLLGRISLQNHQKQLSELLAVYLMRNKLDTPLPLFSVCIILVCFADKISAPFNRQ